MLDQSVDVLFAVTKVTTFDEVLEFSGVEASVGVGELEWPEEVADLLEVGADSVDLVNQILHADDSVFAQRLFNNLIVSEGDALLVDLSIATLVDKLTNGLQVGVPIGNVWVDDGKHLSGSLGKTDEDTIVDLQETEELKNLARLWCNLVDTLTKSAWYFCF